MSSNPQQPTLPRRSTIVPSSFNQKAARRRSTLAPSSFKSRQLSHLNVQLAKLQANMADLDNVLRVTANQAEYVRKIGIMHASLFIAGHKFFEMEAMKAQFEEEERLRLEQELIEQELRELEQEEAGAQDYEMDQ